MDVPGTRAHGLLIIPELVKGGFIVGAEAGFGVFMVRGGMGVDITVALERLAGEAGAPLATTEGEDIDPNRIKPKKGSHLDSDRQSDASGCPTGR